VFKLWAWSADPVAIPLRVWLTVLDPNHVGHGSPSVTVHRQRPSEPKHGMVYDVILHVLSIEDTRRRGTDERPLFFPFQFNLGAPDVDQAVASAPAPRGCDMEQGDDRHHAAARNSCLVEYRSPHHRSHDEDDEDTDGRSGHSFAPQRRSLFQLLCWPSDKNQSRDRSPRMERGESSKQGGRYHGRD
jgi:hypothetical protein